MLKGYTALSSTSKIKNDKEAWQALKKGEEAAFSYIYNKYVDDLFNYGCQINHDKELVKDAIQDVFIELNRCRKRLSDVDAVKAYLYVSLRRELMRKLKRERKHPHHPLREDDKGFEVEISPESNLINNQLAEERAKRFETVINGLSTRQRQAIIYYYYEGFTYREMARLLDLKTSKSARKLLYRAIDTLKNQHQFRKYLKRAILFVLALMFSM